MAGLITLEMYTTRLGRTLSAAKQAQAEAFITDASALVRRIASPELDASDSTTVPAEIVPIIVAMVLRGVDNPRGLTSERIGDYQWAGAGQSIYATDEEVALIRGAAGLNLIREVELSNDVPDRLLLDLELNPGLAGFEYDEL